VNLFQFGFFFGNESLPKLKSKSFQASTDSGSELPSADFLLENVAKIERKSTVDHFYETFSSNFSSFSALSRDSHKEGSSRFVANIVQAANRKIRKTAQRRSTSSSLTPDSLSLDSMTTVSCIPSLSFFLISTKLSCRSSPPNRKPTNP
jgi:hypothetical protein